MKSKQRRYPSLFQEWCSILVPGAGGQQKGHPCHLQAAFKERYETQERDKWKRAAEPFNLHQTANQPVADFLTNIEMFAKKAGLNDAQTVFADGNGLTPILRQAVLTIS